MILSQSNSIFLGAVIMQFNQSSLVQMQSRSDHFNECQSTLKSQETAISRQMIPDWSRRIKGDTR
jgi:hypothetical protein